jgi:hypothetical protein
LSKETLKIVEDNEKKIEPKNEVLTALNSAINQETDIQKMQGLIMQLEELMISQEDIIQYEDYYILSLCIVLKDDELSKEKRSEYVDKWLDRVWKILSGKSYMADLKLTIVLVAQYKKDIENVTRNRLKKFMFMCIVQSGGNGQIDLLRKLITNYFLNNPDVAHIFFNAIICYAHDEWNHSAYNQKIMKRSKGKTYTISAAHGFPRPDDIIKAYGENVYISELDDIVENYLYKENVMEISGVNVEELDPGLLFTAMNVGLRLSEEDFFDFAKEVIRVFIKELSNDNLDSTMNTYYQRLDLKRMLERELTDEKGSYKEAVDLLFDNVDYQEFSNDTVKMYISIFEHVGAVYFDSYDDEAKRIQLQKCIEYVEDYIDKIPVPFVKKGMERILIFDYERFGSNWCKYQTKYSYNDKMFLCGLWKKYCGGHEKGIVLSMYQMKIDELLPEVLPVLSDIVEELTVTGEIADKNSVIILKSIILKTLLNYSNRVKLDKDYHEAYERILNDLIKCNDESAAVILDEYRTH